jgi:hypothetical protein
MSRRRTQRDTAARALTGLSTGRDQVKSSMPLRAPAPGKRVRGTTQNRGAVQSNNRGSTSALTTKGSSHREVANQGSSQSMGDDSGTEDDDVSSGEGEDEEDSADPRDELENSDSNDSVYVDGSGEDSEDDSPGRNSLPAKGKTKPFGASTSSKNNSAAKQHAGIGLFVYWSAPRIPTDALHTHTRTNQVSARTNESRREGK